MPGEEGFISALTAPVVNLAIAAVVVSLIAVVLMALLYVITSRQSSNNLRAALNNTNRLLDTLTNQSAQQAAQGQQISRHGERLESMIRVLEQGQEIQRGQVAETKRLGDALHHHEAKSAKYVDSIQTRADERQRALAEHIKETTAKNMTDLIGATEGIVDKSTRRIVDTLLEGLGTIRAKIETAQADYNQKMEAIGDQVAQMQHKFIQAIQQGVGREQNTVVSVVGVDRDGVGVSGVSGGSARDNGTGHSGGTDGTATVTSA